MTLIDKARRGIATAEVKAVAKKEGLDTRALLRLIADGQVVIPKNKNRKGLDPEGIGTGLRTKVNANIGTSKDKCSTAFEKKKLKAALDAGTDAVMDLSTGGSLRRIRRAIIDACPKPLGTVPIYEALVRNNKRCGGRAYLDVEELFDVIEAQAEEGVDFMTIHAGLTVVALERVRRQPRVTGIVSRGGSFLAAYMAAYNCENPLYENFNRVIDICRRHDVCISLGDGLRPGALADASDRPMLQEMIFLGELAALCLESGVQCIIEGPGHMPINQIESNVRLEKTLCHGAPYYVLGPLVTDVAPGYDHITSAIGGAIAAAAGVDFICYVTPSEHLGLPEPDDVRRGVITARIAAHAADIVKYPKCAEWDRSMSLARKALDWDMQKSLAIDPSQFDRFEKIQKEKDKRGDKTCTMCGEFCAYQITEDIF